MPRFQVGDLIYHPGMPDLYYRVVRVTDSAYYVDQHWASNDTIRSTNQSGTIHNVDQDFMFYKQQTQIRRP